MFYYPFSNIFIQNLSGTGKVFLPNRPLMPQKVTCCMMLSEFVKLAWLDSTDINKSFSVVFQTKSNLSSKACKTCPPLQPSSLITEPVLVVLQHPQAFSATPAPRPTHTLAKVVLFALFSCPWLSYFFFYCCKLSQNYQIPRNPSLPSPTFFPSIGISPPL